MAADTTPSPRTSATSGRLMSRATTLLTALALAVPGLVATPTPASAALGTGVTQTVLVSDPTAFASKTDYRIHEAIVKMVDETPAGAIITHLVWNITYTRYADALIRAHKRGVIIYVAQNGDKSSTQMDRVRTTIGSSRWRICRTTTATGVIKACLSTRVNSYMHAKALTFSQTGTKKHVVVDGTTNMTNHGYENNDMVVTAGDPVLYDAYRDWHSDAFNQRKNDNYLKSANGTRTSSAASATVYFSPQADSTGGTRNEASTDIMALTLKRLTPTSGCSVKFMERYMDNRPHVVAELVRLKRGGCFVKVISDTITQAHIDTLVAAGIPVRKTERTTSFGFNTRIHHKNFVMEGTIDGVAGKRLVATGSQNMTWSSHRLADESFMVLRHGPTVDVYERTFDRVDAKSYKHPGS